MSKFYGVHHNKCVTRYEEWTTCKKALEGLTGFVVKSFKEESAFDEWSDAQIRWRRQYNSSDDCLVAFVDGSVKDVAGEPIPAFGVVIYKDNTIVHEESGIIKNPKQASSRNEAGELEASLRAARWAHSRGQTILIVYDYEGICSYVSGTWEAKTEAAKSYVEEMQSYRHNVRGMHWIKGHGKGNDFLTRGNSYADKLAGNAFDEYSER